MRNTHRFLLSFSARLSRCHRMASLSLRDSTARFSATFPRIDSNLHTRGFVSRWRRTACERCVRVVCPFLQCQFAFVSHTSTRTSRVDQVWPWLTSSLDDYHRRQNEPNLCQQSSDKKIRHDSSIRLKLGQNRARATPGSLLLDIRVHMYVQDTFGFVCLH